MISLYIQCKLRHLCALTLLFSLAACGRASNSALNSQELDPEEFSEYVEKWRQEYNIPGFAIAIVKKGDVIFQQGFGYRDVANEVPIDPETLFAIGSSTKAFTATALAKLVDDGKITWDTKIRDILPDFQLMDAEATEQATVRDLLLHRTGLPRHDFVWFGSEEDSLELYKRFPYLPPNQPFRAKWQYQNLMYMTLGLVIEKISRRSYQSFIEEEIFKPLSMDDSNVTIEEMRNSPNAALGYVSSRTVQPVLVPYRDLANVAAAGAINSNISDMASWLKFHLANGMVGNDSIVSPELMAEMHREQIVAVTKEELAELRLPAIAIENMSDWQYALGWFQMEYRERELINHGGTIDGFDTMVSFMPEEDIGIVVLSNGQNALLDHAISFVAYDKLLGSSFIDWAKELYLSRSVEEPQHGTPPSSLGFYTGTFENPGYGLVRVETITNEEGTSDLQASFNTLKVSLLYRPDLSSDKEHVFDTPLGEMRYLVDGDGGIIGMAWGLEERPIFFNSSR